MDHAISLFLIPLPSRSACHEEEVSQATKGEDSVTWIGKVKLKVAPPPPFPLAHNCPPCDSTMERLMAKPMPLPCGLVVKKAEKIWSTFPTGSPGPVSLTENRS